MLNKMEFFFETIVIPIILYGCEVCGCNISREYWRKTKQIQKRYITYNLKIKINTPYPILLIEVGLFPIESMAMTRYMMYNHKINNMGNKRLPKIALNSNKNMVKTNYTSSDAGVWIP